MNQSHANVAGGFAGRADCHVANGQIGYQNTKTVTLDASNEGVRCTPVGAPSIDKNTINPIALCAYPIGARGQFGTQDTPQTALSEAAQPTHVIRHCARPVRRPLMAEYRKSRSVHRPCAVASGSVGEAELSTGYLGKLEIYYKINSAWRSIYAGQRSRKLEKLAKFQAVEAVNEIGKRISM